MYRFEVVLDDVELVESLQRIARDEDTSVSELIYSVLMTFVEREEGLITDEMMQEILAEADSKDKEVFDSSDAFFKAVGISKV